MKIKVTRLDAVQFKIELETELTDMQLEYINCIEEYKYRYKKVPTIRKIAELKNVKSPATVKDMLDKLKEKGYNYKLL